MKDVDPFVCPRLAAWVLLQGLAGCDGWLDLEDASPVDGLSSLLTMIVVRCFRLFVGYHPIYCPRLVFSLPPVYGGP